MSQYYNYKTALLILFMSLTAYLILILGLYYNPSLMGNTPQAVRYIVLGVFESLLLVPLLLYLLGNGKSLKHAFRLHTVSIRGLRDILFVAVGMFVFLEFVQYLLEGLYGSETFISDDLKVLYPLNYIIVIPVMAIITPIVEEAVFRGYFLRVMLRNKISPILAVVLQAIVFAIAHLSLKQAPVIFLAGLILGFMAYSFHSIVPSVIIHSIFNTLALLNINVPKISEDIISGRAYIPWLIVIGGTLLLVIGLVSVRRNVRIHHHHRRTKEI